MLNLFYKIVNGGYRLTFGNEYMLHAPLFLKTDETLFDAQRSFSDYCLSFLPMLAGRRVLDIGCGNGILTRHLSDRYCPSSIHGIDIIAAQIAIAKRNAAGTKNKISFGVADAQDMSGIADNSFDVVICFESALHYRDKDSFLSEMKRVLTPGGHFLIADLLKRSDQRPGFFQKTLHLFNWSHREYMAAFERHHLEIITDEDLNDFLLPHFNGAFKKVAREIRSKKMFASSFYQLLIKPFYSVYLFQLRNSFRYQLFTGKIPDQP